MIPKPKIDPKKQRANMAKGFYVLDSPTPRHTPQRVRGGRLPNIMTMHDVDRMLPDAGLHKFEEALDKFLPDDQPDDLFDL